MFDLSRYFRNKDTHYLYLKYNFIKKNEYCEKMNKIKGRCERPRYIMQS